MATDRQQLYQKHDRLRQLRVFCHTARLGSLTKAAEQLRLSPPAVSLQVRELERELEAVLFDRGGPRIALSPAGERLYQLAMPLVEGMDRLPDTLAGEVDDLVSGDLHVASGDAGAVYVLPRVLKRLRDEHPGIRTSVRIGVLGSGLALLLADEVELVFGAKGPVSEDFVYHPVLSYDLVLVTSRDHPLAGRETVSREETAAHPVIMPDFGTYSLQGGESPLRHLGIEASVVIEVGGWDVVERYVEAGLGIAFCGSFCVSEESRVSVIPLREHFPKRSYGWFMHRDKPLSLAAEWCVQAMEAEFPEGSQGAPGRR